MQLLNGPDLWCGSSVLFTTADNVLKRQYTGEPGLSGTALQILFLLHNLTLGLCQVESNSALVFDFILLFNTEAAEGQT